MVTRQAVDFDVLIAGGGLVGACCAAALAQSGVSVAVLEARAPTLQFDPTTIDLRVSAISRASERIFRHLAAWDGMVRRRVSPYREMHVWDSAGAGAVHFDSADIAEPSLGYIIENRVIQAALWERLQSLPNVTLLCPSTVASWELRDNAIHVRTTEQRVWRARLLIGADGADSRVRELANIVAHGWMYDQHAVVAAVTTEQPHADTAWQRFLPDGPLAFLPLNNGQCSIVWSTTPTHAAQLLELDDAAFAATLEVTFAGRLGRILHCGPRASFALRLQYAQRYVRSRIALIGDAAHSVHPLAGQGANLGFLDAAALAEVVVAAAAAGLDIGDERVLARYERWRKGDNVLMMGAMDGIKRLFGPVPAPLVWLRNAGLQLTDQLTPAKEFFIRRAMGLNGDLPELARR